MTKKAKNGSEFRSPSKIEVATAGAIKAAEFSKLSSGEKYIL